MFKAMRRVKGKVHDKKGFTLIELVIVIAVIGVLVTAMMKGFGFVTSSKVSGVAKQAETLRQGALAWKYGLQKANYTDLTAGSVLVNGGFVRTEDLTSVGGGSHTVAVNTDTTKFDITLLGTEFSGDQLNNLKSAVEGQSGGTCVVTEADNKVACTFAG